MGKNFYKSYRKGRETLNNTLRLNLTVVNIIQNLFVVVLKLHIDNKPSFKKKNDISDFLVILQYPM